MSFVFAKKKQDNRPQHLIHVLIKCPCITTRAVVLGFKHLDLPKDLASVMHENLCLLSKLIFCEKWGEDQSTLTLIY